VPAGAIAGRFATSLIAIRAPARRRAGDAQSQHSTSGTCSATASRILDAADPRQLKPVAFHRRDEHPHAPSSGVERPHAAGQRANIVAMQSYDNMRGYFENALATASRTGRSSVGAQHSHISKPADMREIAFLEIPVSASTAVVDRRPLRVSGRALRRLHGSRPRRRGSAEHPKRRSCRSGGCPGCIAPAASLHPRER